MDTSQLMPLVLDTEPEVESSSSESSDDSFDEDDDSVLDGGTDDAMYLQPIPTKKRRLMLRLALFNRSGYWQLRSVQ